MPESIFMKLDMYIVAYLLKARIVEAELPLQLEKAFCKIM
jgi:hypothetical protein